MNDVLEIERELEQARSHLHRTLAEMNYKAAAGSEIRATEERIRRYPAASVCAALALGLAAGRSTMPAMLLGMLAIGGMLMVGPDNESGTNGGSDGAI